jgi:branched-chain amino acid transport system ATP-binding protein
VSESATVQAATSADALTVEDLSVHYGGVCAVRSIGFTVAPGQAVGIIGANGAGKTSTLKALMGLVPRSGGRVSFGGTDLTRIKARDVVRHGIGYVPEGRHVFPGLTVEKNLLLGAYARSWRGEQTRQSLAEVYELFPVLGEMRVRLAGALSGGQQQMLAVGRALMSRPSVLLLDEPSLGLSPILVQEIFAIISEINQRGTTILLVEQNALQALHVAHRGYVLQTGRVILADRADKLAANQDVRRAYLGEI